MAKIGYLRSNLSEPAGAVVAVVSGAVFPVCRSLLVGVAGTATLVDFHGNIATDVPLQAGYNPIRASKVTFGTASDIWALY